MPSICFPEQTVVKMMSSIIEQTVPTMKGKEQEIWISGDQVRAILKCSTSHLQNLRDRDEIKFSKISGKHILYKKESVYKLIENRQSKI